MLKSTHKVVDAPSPLHEGWTEHKAPTGHSYYYNPTTKESTYTRPTAHDNAPPNIEISAGTPLEPLPNIQHGFFIGDPRRSHLNAQPEIHNRPSQYNANGRDSSHNKNRDGTQDRPKTKESIIGCEPWVIVKTKLGRRFVHNPETQKSFWRFPPDVMKGVVEHDRLERERNLQAEKDDSKPPTYAAKGPKEAEHPELAPKSTELRDAHVRVSEDVKDSDEDEYEEVEVTEDEEDDGDNPSKRLKEMNDVEDKPVEFDEEDIAYQLAAMGEDYGLDPTEMGIEGESMDEADKGLPLTEEDSSALFKDMLEDYHINPYTTWERLIEIGEIIEDDRYTVLPNMRSRKEVFSQWSRDRIQALKQSRAQEEQKDPRIPYFAFLESKATPKLYWPEFRRKYQKEPEFRNTKLSDRDREKWYREYVNRLKLPESRLKADLISLLKSASLGILNRSSSPENLPSFLLTDLRYISLRGSVRDPLIEAHINSLEDAPTISSLSPEEERARSKQREERGRREKALAERQKNVEDEKRRQRGALQHSKGMLREEEEEIERAMHIRKDGLKGYVDHT